MKQWYFKITHYAEELVKDLKDLSWPEQVIEMQRGWIGRSKGVTVDFGVIGANEVLSAFTTKVETLMGVTFVAISAEHPILSKIQLTENEINFLAEIKKKTETLRKIGFDVIEISNLKVSHPITREELPVIVAEYVLANYGTGCVMGVPGHDERDLKAAQLLSYEVREVIKGDSLINSGIYSELPIKQATSKIIEELKQQKSLSPKVCYRIRDWLVSRQRYWGVPIPIVHCNNCGSVPDNNIPIMLPQKHEKESWLHTNCPKCHGPALRESDTLDTFVDSSWYYLRYPDSQNDSAIFDKNIVDKWAPVDLYVGGIEHAIMHLLYARFIHKALRDEGLLNSNEPFTNLLTQGLVLGQTFKHNGRYISQSEAGSLENVECSFEKMSKSKKNGVNPIEIAEEWGVDVLRLSILFAAPSEKQVEWDGNLLKTMRRWINQLWEYIEGELGDEEQDFSKWLKGIQRSMENRKFHVVIARLMEHTEVIKEKPTKQNVKLLLLVMHPFAPHFTAEAYTKLFSTDITNEKWPAQ